MAVGRMAEIGRAGKRVGRHYTLFRGFGLQAALQTKQLQQFRPEMFEQDGPYCESRANIIEYAENLSDEVWDEDGRLRWDFSHRHLTCTTRWHPYHGNHGDNRIAQSRYS